MTDDTRALTRAERKLTGKTLLGGLENSRNRSFSDPKPPTNSPVDKVSTPGPHSDSENDVFHEAERLDSIPSETSLDWCHEDDTESLSDTLKTYQFARTLPNTSRGEVL